MLAKEYMSLGLMRQTVLDITGLTRHQLYYESTGSKVGKQPTNWTLFKEPKTQLVARRNNEELVKDIIAILGDKDLPNWYRLVAATLQVKGWYINHKKVYRLEQENGLLRKAKKRKGRNFVQFRRVCPMAPLRILEMDIKYVWIAGKSCYAYVLTILDTFTRFALHWAVGYTMKQEQVKDAWDQVIVKYLQTADLLGAKISVEIRNDNGKQFSSQMIQQYFRDNHLNQVFTHPYSPEENGHVESFHKTLGSSLKGAYFHTLKDLENRLAKFYTTYNNHRQHSSIAMLSPSMFWALWEDQQIEITVFEKKKARFKLCLEMQDVLSWNEIHRYEDTFG
ncbi:MAG: DDE-type integrase/transposase/recombinase [Bacteroidota bacterium]